MQKIITIDKNFYFELGKQIRKRREHLDMTQLELSKYVGCCRPLITAIENGYTKVSPKKWERICEALNILPGINIDVELDKKDIEH